MDIAMDQASIQLGKNDVLEVRDGTGHRIVCYEGAVWITEEGDSQDIVVNAGESFTSHGAGKTLVGALEGSAISID